MFAVELVTLIVLLLAALFAAWQVLEVRKDRKARHRPYVVADFEETQTNVAELAVSNIGLTPAYDVQVTFNEEPRTALDQGRWEALDSTWLANGVQGS